MSGSDTRSFYSGGLCTNEESCSISDTEVPQVPSHELSPANKVCFGIRLPGTR